MTTNGEGNRPSSRDGSDVNTRLDPSREEWMNAAETRAVMNALVANGGNARFVGGAVRNALLGRDVDDVDIATPLLPDEVVRRLEFSRIRAVPTGIVHGTVTAIVNRRALEITTLRRDVETDGRHAVVAFSGDWAEDAARRDFTINALYAAEDGEVFDYTGGLADLAARRIRFIGDPVARIREDYLRILRLFRFHAWYGQGAMDEPALRAAAAERAGMRSLSGERVQKEMLRLLAAAYPSPAIRMMAKTGVLEEIISGTARIDRLERLAAIDAEQKFAADSVLRLCSLTPADPAIASRIATRLKFSNENRDRMIDLSGTNENFEPGMPQSVLRRLLYRLGTQRVRDRILLRWSEDPDTSHHAGWRELFEAAHIWTVPRFPLTGGDVLATGVAEGRQVGAMLSKLEADWIESDFSEDRQALLDRLMKMAQFSSG